MAVSGHLLSEQDRVPTYDDDGIIDITPLLESQRRLTLEEVKESVLKLESVTAGTIDRNGLIKALEAMGK
jgi:hypothetical protein